MSPAEIIQAAMGDGVVVTVSPDGIIKAIGEQTAVNRWRLTLRENKADLVRLLTGKEYKPTARASTFGCGACGNMVYRQVTVWECTPLPPGGDWQYEHRPAVGWQCETCGAVFPIIGGSRGPVLLQ